MHDLRGFLLIITFFGGCTPSISFSILNEWRRARVSETAGSIDASRYHLQILFVDDDNERGRIAEGLFERISVFNDLGFWLYPWSATVSSGTKISLRTPSVGSLAVCQALSLCPESSRRPGALLNDADFDYYDMIVCLDDDVRAAIFRTLSPEKQDFYDRRIVLLSDFIGVYDSEDPLVLLNMLQPDLTGRCAGLMLSGEMWSDSMRAKPTKGVGLILSPDGMVVPSDDPWPTAQAAMILATAGLTKFCRTTIDESFSTAFDCLLETYFYREEDLLLSIREADEVIRRNTISGFFSLEERQRRFEAHREKLAMRLQTE